MRQMKEADYMRMSKLVASVVLVAALGVAGVAYASGALSIAFKGSNVVTYGYPVHVKVTVPAGATTTATVQYRYAGGEWISARPSIAASRAAESTVVANVTFKPKWNFEVRAVQGSLESSVATGGVRAKLHINSKGAVRHDTTVTVSGSIAPTHPVDALAVQVAVYKLEVRMVAQKNDKSSRGKLKPTIVPVLVGEYDGKVTKNSGGISHWKASVPFGAKGVYMVKAIHQDDGHLASASRTLTVKVR
jgi:hypothetical protein